MSAEITAKKRGRPSKKAAATAATATTTPNPSDNVIVIETAAAVPKRKSRTSTRAKSASVSVSGSATVKADDDDAAAALASSGSGSSSSSSLKPDLKTSKTVKSSSGVGIDDGVAVGKGEVKEASEVKPQATATAKGRRTTKSSAAAAAAASAVKSVSGAAGMSASMSEPAPTSRSVPTSTPTASSVTPSSAPPSSPIEAAEQPPKSSESVLPEKEQPAPTSRSKGRRTTASSSGSASASASQTAVEAASPAMDKTSKLNSPTAAAAVLEESRPPVSKAESQPNTSPSATEGRPASTPSVPVPVSAPVSKILQQARAFARSSVELHDNVSQLVQEREEAVYSASKPNHEQHIAIEQSTRASLPSSHSDLAPSTTSPVQQPFTSSPSPSIQPQPLSSPVVTTNIISGKRSPPVPVAIVIPKYVLPQSTVIALAARNVHSQRPSGPASSSSSSSSTHGPSLPPSSSRRAPGNPAVSSGFGEPPQGPRPTQIPLDELKKTPEFRALSRRWTSLIVALPFAIVTSYFLWQRYEEHLAHLKAKEAARKLGVKPPGTAGAQEPSASKPN